MLKKLLIGIAAVIVLLIAAAIVVPYLIPLDTYKARIVALVKTETGRNLRIAGPVRFSLLPNIALEANDVSLSNPPGAASPDMARLKSLDLELKLLPLLHGAIEVSEFKLVQPTIALEVDKRGRPNWVFGAATPSTPAAARPRPAPARPAPPPATRSSSSALSAITLGDVSIVDGRASYLDRRTGEKRLLSDINMSFSLARLDRPFTAKGSAIWNGDKVKLTVGVQQPGRLESGGTSPVEITLAAKPIDFALKGDATGATLSKLNGGIDLSIPSVRGFAKWVGIAFNPPGSGFGPMTLSGHIDKAGPRIAFTNAVITLDAIKAKGALTVDSSGPRPDLSGRLDVDKLDVNPYLPPESRSGKSTGAASSHTPSGGGRGSGSAPQPASHAAGKSAGWSNAPIDFSALKLVNANFALSANAITYRKIQIGHSVIALHLRNGRFEADLERMALYQGNGHGKLVIDASGATPAIAANFDLAGVAIQPLLRDAAGFDRLIGSGSLGFAVTGHGDSQRAIVASLDGRGSLNLAKGKIEGVNLVAFMKNTAAALAGGTGGANDTDFGTLSGTCTIRHGILRNDDLKLTSPEVPMTGAGTVDMPMRQVNYRVTPSVSGLLAVPVDITGPWNDLRYRPDLTGIAKGLAQHPEKLLKGLKNGGQNAGAAASGLLKSLLGK